MSLVDRILRPGGKQAWVALDASPEGLFVASVTPPTGLSGKPVVASCASLRGEGFSVESLEKLSRSFSHGKLNWVMPLQHKSYNILVVEEPPVHGEEMEQSVRWSVSSMIDYPVAEATVSWMKIPTETLMPNRTPHIYVMVARREVVEEYRAAFHQAKLHLGAIDVQETAQRNVASLLASEGQGVALLSVTPRGVQLTVTFQGELYLDRYVEENVFPDAGDEASVERACERVVLQIQRSLDFIGRTLQFIDIGKVYLAPMPGSSPLSQRIAENLPVPLELLDLASVFDLSAVPHLQGDEREQASYFRALGAGLRFLGGAA